MLQAAWKAPVNQYRSPVMVEVKGKDKINCYFVNEDWCE